MTNQILQSDIDLARRLLGVGRPEAEIVKALGFRRVDAERATRLINDLRQGRNVEPDVSQMGSLPRAPREHSVSARHVNLDPGQFAAHEPKRRMPWFMISLLVALAVCTGAVIVSNHRTHARIAASRALTDQAEETADTTVRALARTTASGVVSVELSSDGVHVGSRLLNRTNALGALVQVFGPPSRTNFVEGTVMYAYDTQGLVVHCQKEQQNDCLVLYFDALGGENGARQPFSGTLRIGGHRIQGTTDTQTLTSFKELNLNQQGSNSVMETRCHGVPISFAYLESPARLSLVQIELK